MPATTTAAAFSGQGLLGRPAPMDVSLSRGKLALTERGHDLRSLSAIHHQV